MPETNETTIEKLLRNLRFIRPDGKITVAAILLFGKYTQRWLPVMTAKCISYIGNSIGGTQFRDKMHDMEIEGNLLHQFRTIMNFFTRNLRKVQVEKEFNSIGELEIPYESLTEYVVNALVHQSLNIKSPIRIFIFDNRVEIHSPGTLPNGLTIEDIKNGNQCREICSCSQMPTTCYPIPEQEAVYIVRLNTIQMPFFSME